MYLIFLTSRSDTDIRLISAPIWEWVIGENKDAIHDGLPQIVKDEMVKYNVTIEESDDEQFDDANDRAMFAPGIKFDTITAMCTYLRINKIELIDEFVGCLY